MPFALSFRSVVVLFLAWGLGIAALAQDIETCLISNYSAGQGTPLPIPEAQATCLTDSLVVSWVDSTLTWEDLDPSEQVLSINMEHSYVGDLIITYTCPNGQSITVYEQGGGPSSVGEPAWVADSIGFGYDYFWSDQANNPLTFVSAGYGQPGTVPSGVYQPITSLDALNGCPISGTWHLEVCDVLAADDGYVFGWGVPYAQLEAWASCFSVLTLESESAYSYCTPNGAIRYAVDSVLDIGMTVTLSQGGSVLESAPLQAQNTYADLAHGTYTLSFATDSQEFGSYDITVEDAIYPYYNAGADPICSASLDAAEGWNRINWEKQDASFIGGFDLYRESNVTSEFEWIGTVHGDSLSTFLDVGFDPGASSTRYNLVAVDSCGGEIDFAGAHRTIHLQSNLGVNGEVNLFWNPYEGVEYDNFSIHRSTDGETYFPVGTVANNVYAFTDQFPPAGNKWYQIRIPLDNACEPVRTRSTSFIGSNINALSISSVTESAADRAHLVRVGDQWTLSWTDLSGGTADLLDMMGRVVWTQSLGDSNRQLSFTPPAAGSYLLRVSPETPGACFLQRIVH